MGAGRDVEEHHLIRALFVVAKGKLDWIAHIAQATLFRASKLDAPGDLSAVDIQARYDASRQHGEVLNGRVEGGSRTMDRA